MSKLEELIARLCPDGVEYDTVGRICDLITDYTAAGSFADVAKNVKYLKTSGFAQLIRTTDLKSGFNNINTFVYVDEHAFKYLWRVNLNSECLVLPNVGNCGEVYYITPNIFPCKNNVLGPNAILVKSSFVSNKYLFYLFQSDGFQKELSKITSTTGQTKFNKTNFKMIKLPVPPLEVQREIVHILDSYTASNKELKEQLDKELAARQKQYEWYRDKLLSFTSNVEIVRLSEIACFYNGDRGKNYPKVSEMVLDGIPFVNAGDVNGIVDTINCNKITREKYNSLGGAKLRKNDVLYCLRGSTGKNGIYDKDEGTVASSLVAIRVDSSKASFKYIYYLLNSKFEIKQRLKAATGAAQPNLSAQNVKNYEFPLPPLSEQQRIVDILDRFDALCNDITSGLPAEIEARKKQYEYYRDKLLTFKELKKEA